MCGIFALVQNVEFDPGLVLDQLTKLEYRGYDSWGVAVKNDQEFDLEKKTGKIGDSQLSLLPTTLAVGHTRWATHGGVTTANAHPHLNESADLAIIHNGIIENHGELWADLVAQANEIGKKLTKKSQTDSEVSVYLVDSLKQELGLAEAVRVAFTKLKGLSAFVVADAATDTLVAIKTGSPLVIGVGKHGNYLASDAHSLLKFTKKIIFLEDNQMAVVTAEHVTGFDVLTGKKIALKVETLDWSEAITQKGEFAHFSLKEIHEQPRILRSIATTFDAEVAKLVELVSNFQKIYLVGCGTASYAALYSKYLLAVVAHKEVVVVSGSEISHVETFMGVGSLVIFFSQSGETIDIVQPLKRVKKNGATTVALVNVFGSSLARLADHCFLLKAGPEVSVMSTKALMAMVGVITRVAYLLAGEDSRAKRLMLTIATSQESLLTKKYFQEYIQPVTKYLQQVDHCFVIGRGQSYPVALEAALKLKEVTYLHAEGFAAGELKHGVIALIERGTPCLVFAPSDENFAAVISSATEVKARGGTILGVAAADHEVFDFLIPVSDSDAMRSVNQIVVAQLLAYHLSVAKGIDPDKPRNLAKSVTVG